jgi:lipid II:glycine glycyltransferase (peptidoglycan interpeptide bridge formation enzyme)
MIISSRSSVRIADLYFDEQPPPRLSVDIVRYNQAPAEVHGAICTPFPTIVLDLRQSPDQMLANMKQHTRYKIRRGAEAARTNEITYLYSSNGDSESVREFADHFDRCAALKNLPNASRERLSILSGNGALDVSFIRDRAGEILAASSYVVTPLRVRGLYAGVAHRATADPSRRTRIGYANRYLYWSDILRFRSAGVHLFDFGGYYTGVDDEEKLRVNGFKSEFGGLVVNEFNCEQTLTLKGQIAAWFLHHRERRLWKQRAAKTEQTIRTQEQHESSLPASV